MALTTDTPVLSPALIASLSRGEVVVSDVGPTVPGVTAANTPRFLLELARAAAGGSLQPGKVVLAVRASGIDATAEALGEALADALWYAWQEVEDAPSGGDAKSRLADVAKDALKEALVTKQQLFCVGDGEFFEECGLVVNREMWRKREIRSHTKHVYQQRKFNLLREESEGYAKLATLLNQQAAGRLTEASTPAVLAEMKALIGYFDLDPNRCFSVVLDAFTSQPSNDAFLGLMPAFSADACAQVLGFHFYRCREDSAVQPPRPAKPAPQGLFVAAAKLVQAGRTSLEALLSHMAPSDEEMKTAFEEGSKKMAEGISRIGIISLVSAADTAAPLAPPGLGLRREPSGALGGGSAAAGEAGQGTRRSGLTAVALELAATSYAAPLTSLEASNQRLLLLAALLQIGDWEHAQQLMRWLRALGVSDFAVFPAVGRALCELIGRELAPVYAAACSPAASQPDVLSVQLPPRLLELLTVAGQHLYHDITVLTKLVRTLAAILASNNGMHPTSKATHEQVLELLTQTVLPAMSLIPGNAGLVYEIWRALEQLPYTDRFCIYADALKEGPKSSPLLTAAAKLAETEVRRILRRVTAPANKKEAKVTMKPLGRMLAKIMHAAPLAVAEQLIRQVMGMPGMVTSIVESLKYLTPMAFDVMTFAILKQLASPKKKLKDDGVNLEEWYQWLAAFTGLLCKKHGEVEVNALLQYVANQLKSSESLDLLVLKEMVQTMTGHQAVFDVSEGQLDALAGSDTLKAEVITQGEHRSSDKSLQRASARLLAALTQGESAEQRLAMPLLVLLAQQRKLIVLQSQSTHLKLIAELYDKCQEVCTQYAEFLQHALPEADYRALLPSMEDLATEYSVDPELIFSFYRPLIRGTAPPAAAAVDGAGGAAGEQQEEEGEIGEMSTSPAGGAKGGAEAMEEDGQLEAGEVAASGTLVPPPPPPAPDAAQRWEELEAQVRAMHGASSDATPWRGLSPTLYTTFWALQLYDLEVPTARYEATISQLRTDIRIARGDIETAKRDAERPPMHYGGHGGFGFRGPPPPEMPLAPTVDIEQLGKDIERAQAALDKLPGELKAQQANAAAVERRLQSEKGSWVLDGHAARVVLPREFSQHCILPRMLNSPSDAIYCARFLKKVHTLNVPGFNLLNTLNHVMREFGFLVRVCTAREATNFGIFLNEVLALVERWRTKDIFAKECANSQCFKVVASGKAVAGKAAPAAPAEGAAEGAAADAKADGKAAEQAAAAGALRNVDHREFLNLSHNWQKKLTDEVFSSCLQSGDYMQAKNALLALNRCVKVYPATKLDASKLIDILAPMRDKDPREDLKTLARMYCTGLEMQMRDKTRNMVATREEYAGLPPKKRPARPAVSKGAAGSEGGKPAAAAPAAKEAKEGGKDAAAAKESGGKGKAEAQVAAAGAAAEGEKRAAGGGKDEGRRTTDSSKGPSLPPGLGGTARGRREEPAQRPERERREERRREERGAAPAAHDGPPPGFGSADKLKHAGSSTELRRAAEQPTPAAAAAGSERERRGERVRDERPPRPSGRAEEQQRREQPQREQPAVQPAGREREKERDERKSAGLRADAPAFQPREGTRGSTGSTRAAEEAAAAERDTKRPRREEAPTAAAGGSGREREQREKEQRAADKPAERGSRERPSARGGEGKDAAAAPGGRGERPASGERRHSREEAREGGKEREERHHRPASGERQERDSGVGSKRKREDEQPQPKPADRPSSREGKEQHPAAAQREQRERPSGREAAAEGRAEEGHRSRRHEGAAEAEDARAAAKAAAAAEREAGERRHRSRDAEAEQQPSKPVQKSSGPAAAAAPGATEADSGDSSDSDADRGRRDRKRDKKKRKEKKEKKEKRHKKERSTDKEASQQPPAEEHDSKRQRREEMPELPARLRGRLGSGGLLGAALKGIVQEGGTARHEERPDDSGRRRRHEEQQEERVVREVREEREDKRRRGGRSRR